MTTRRALDLVALVGCAFAVVIGVLVLASFTSKPNEASAPKVMPSAPRAQEAVVNESAQAPPSATAPRAVSCTLEFERDDVDALPFFPTKEGDDAFVDLLARGEVSNAELFQLITKKGAITLRSGAPCSVVDAGILRSQVRVLEGKHLGETVWAPTEYVKCR